MGYNECKRPAEHEAPVPEIVSVFVTAWHRWTKLRSLNKKATVLQSGIFGLIYHANHCELSWSCVSDCSNALLPSSKKLCPVSTNQRWLVNQGHDHSHGHSCSQSQKHSDKHATAINLQAQPERHCYNTHSPNTTHNLKKNLPQHP